MIKKKKWLSICLVICLIGGIGGAAWYRQKKIEERRMSLVYIPKVEDSTNDFWKALILGTKMAAKEYNADIEIKAPTEENDIERQNELLKEAISEEPDAILFSPSSFTESNDLLKEAKEKGIRISFIDSYTEEKVQDLTVATDNLEAGEKLGKFAATLLDPDDQIAIVAHVKGVSTAVEREEGFRKGLGDLAKNIVEVVYCDSQYEKSRKLVIASGLMGFVKHAYLESFLNPFQVTVLDRQYLILKIHHCFYQNQHLQIIKPLFFHLKT